MLLPETLSYEQAVPIFCAGYTTAVHGYISSSAIEVDRSR
jgi:hypothetical protein